jgi:TonB family protein
MRFLLLFLGTALATCVPAQQAETGAVSTSVQSSAQSPDGLRVLVGNIFGAVQSGDRAAVSTYCENLLIPDHHAWFLRTFGTDEGSRLDAKYGEILAADSIHYRKLFETVVFHGGTDIQITLLQKPVDPGQSAPAYVAAMVNPVPLYVVQARTRSQDAAVPGRPVAGLYFVYVEGGFRLLDLNVLQALSTAPALRIRVGSSVLGPNITYKVAPVYPDQAKAAGIKGDVVLHVIVGTDGAIKEATVVSGDPILGQAALDAVRQWKYRPTLVNSKPVEVDSTVTIQLP